jgi:hypothetical protein
MNDVSLSYNPLRHDDGTIHMQKKKVRGKEEGK